MFNTISREEAFVSATTKFMPVQVIDLRKDIPKPQRHRKSALEDTEEYRYVMTKLAAGLKPNEGLRIVLSGPTLKKVKNAPRLFKAIVQKYVTEMKLDYDVFHRGTTPEGTPILYVAGRSASGKHA